MRYDDDMMMIWWWYDDDMMMMISIEIYEDDEDVIQLMRMIYIFSVWLVDYLRKGGWNIMEMNISEEGEEEEDKEEDLYEAAVKGHIEGVQRFLDYWVSVDSADCVSL